MQINPHFLFNTLNSVATLVYSDPRAADEMLADLSELLRRSLDSMEEQEVALAQEIEFVAAYMRIEQKRFGDRVRLDVNIPDELLKAMVPALILQPLVENSIRHGLEPRRGQGLITIQAEQVQESLHLIVRDDGRGLPTQGTARAAGTGIGISNTKARLEALYGASYDFQCGKAEPQGCQVDIHLPLHFQPTPFPSFPAPAHL